MPARRARPPPRSMEPEPPNQGPTRLMAAFTPEATCWLGSRCWTCSSSSATPRPEMASYAWAAPCGMAPKVPRGSEATKLRPWLNGSSAPASFLTSSGPWARPLPNW